MARALRQQEWRRGAVQPFKLSPVRTCQEVLGFEDGAELAFCYFRYYLVLFLLLGGLHIACSGGVRFGSLLPLRSRVAFVIVWLWRVKWCCEMVDSIIFVSLAVFCEGRMAC